MPNAVVNFAARLGEQHELYLPNICKYAARKAEWRAAVADWFGLNKVEAKRELLRACFGCASVRCCPLLEGLAADAEELTSCLCKKHPEVLAVMQEVGKPRPRVSVLAYFLFDMEHKCLEQFTEMLSCYGLALVAPVFDGVVAYPEAGANVEGLLTAFEEATGIGMQVAPIVRSVEEEPGMLCQRLEPFVIADTEVIQMSGPFASTASALANLWPDKRAALEELLSPCESPRTYGELLRLVPCLRLWPVAEDATLEAGAYLIYEPCPDGCAGLSLAACVADVHVTVYTRSVYRLTVDYLAEQRRLCSMHIFRAEWQERPQDKRHKSSFPEWGLLVG